VQNIGIAQNVYSPTASRENILKLSSLARFLRGGSAFLGGTEEHQIPRSAVQMIGALTIFSAERGMTVSGVCGGFKPK
jgi:predicted ABC-type sugar transport system permease subunit